MLVLDRITLLKQLSSQNYAAALNWKARRLLHISGGARGRLLGAYLEMVPQKKIGLDRDNYK